MNKKLWIGLFSVLLIGFAICGCSEVVQEEPSGGIEGYIYAADGVTPIAGARIWTTGSVYETATDTEGYFKLDAPVGTKEVYVKKGTFSVTLSNVTFVEGEINPVGDQDKKIYLDPNRNQPGIVVTVDKIAVVTGSWDRMQDVLAKLGYGSVDTSGTLILGTEQFDLYDGNGSLSGTYAEFDALVTSPSTMNQYKVIFINCGNSDEDLLFDNPSVVENIRNYVSAGGSLYVTDLSYDFVEQVFPEYIDFYGSDATLAASPEIMDAAEVGTSGITVNAEVLDDTLKSWLQGRGALNPDGTVHIAGFLSGWAVMNSVASGTKTWVRGNVSFAGLGVTGQASHSQAASPKAYATELKPLTVSFNYGDNDGKVLYTSYHTEDVPDPTLRPQEYILAYLIFEM